MKISEIKEIAEREFGEQPIRVEEIEEGLKQETYRITFEKTSIFYNSPTNWRKGITDWREISRHINF